MQIREQRAIATGLPAQKIHSSNYGTAMRLRFWIDHSPRRRIAKQIRAEEGHQPTVAVLLVQPPFATQLTVKNEPE
jgi:hypothetical protein